MDLLFRKQNNEFYNCQKVFTIFGNLKIKEPKLETIRLNKRRF